MTISKFRFCWKFSCSAFYIVRIAALEKTGQKENVDICFSAIAKIDFWGDWEPGYVQNHFFNVSRNS